jgi:SAM-dependent methyltransferase
MDVLDLGCGDGTTAVPEAQAGANVLGVDIAENLIAAGTARAEELGLDNLKFQWGDATNLGDLSDDSFDLVVSIFGAMFAPRPNDVAKEMVRVTRPGGRVVMGNWIPGDPTFVAQLLKVSATYSPPPPEGFISPVTWGVEENAGAVPRGFPGLLRADDERVRRGERRRTRRRAPRRADGACRRAQHGDQRRDAHRSGLSPRNRSRLTRRQEDDALTQFTATSRTPG